MKYQGLMKDLSYLHVLLQLIQLSAQLSGSSPSCPTDTSAPGEPVGLVGSSGT